MTCSLCDLPTPDPPITSSGVTGHYCCHGCLEVSRRLDELEHADQSGDVRNATEPKHIPDEETEEVVLGVDGMHCSACEVFLESVGTEHDGVISLDANYAAGMVKLAYRSDIIGRDDLSDIISGLGYTIRDPGHPRNEFTSIGRLLVGGFFGMMVMVWYVLFLYPSYLGLEPQLLNPKGTAGRYLLANVWVMTTVVLGYTGYPLLRGAYVSVRARQANMDLLVSIAAITAYGYSSIIVLLGSAEVYFDIVIVIVMAVMIGNFYEERVKHRASDRLGELTELRVDTATRKTDTGTEEVSIDSLRAGEELLVRAGDRVPIDGTIVDGSAAVDESLLSGESRPIEKQAGDQVIGGSVVREGVITMHVNPAEQSTVDRVLMRLWDIQTQPATGRLADRVAAVFVPVVIILAIGTAGWHLVAGQALTEAVLIGLAVLVVSCPCALGLATPLAVAAGVNTGLARGVVFSNGEVFERAPEITTVAFDKTGTLTTGEMRVIDVIGGGLEQAVAVEANSLHPVAEAITGHGESNQHEVSEFERIPGLGVRGRVNDTMVFVGHRDLFVENGWGIPDSFRLPVQQATETGYIPVLVGWDGTVNGVIVVGDDDRDQWEDAIETLAESYQIVVLTGDSEQASARFRECQSISEVFTRVPPEAKSTTIDRLKTDGPVAMVGDGTNDGPALATANLGIGLGSGTALAQDAADAVIMNNDLGSVDDIFGVTIETNRRIRQNLAWAFLYNGIAVPLAMLGVLNPLLAAVAMATSSVLVVGNSVRSFGTR